MWPCIETKPLAGNSEKKAKQKSKAFVALQHGGFSFSAGKKNKETTFMLPRSFHCTSRMSRSLHTKSKITGEY